MTWVRLSDNFLFDPAIAKLSPSTLVRYIGLLCYSAAHLTDGRVDLRVAKSTAPHATQMNRRSLVESMQAGLITISGNEVYLVRWREHIEPKDKVLQRRSATLNRVNRHRCNAVSNGVGNAAPGPARTEDAPIGASFPARRKRAGSTSPTPVTETHMVRVGVEGLYRSSTGGQEHVWSAACAANAKRLASAIGVEEVLRRYEIFCQEPPAWLAEGAPDFLSFARHVNQLASNGRRGAAPGSTGKNGKLSADDLAALAVAIRNSEGECHENG